MRASNYHNAENPNLRVASYESLLDLFTLLSFMLILAAFFFVKNTSQGAQGVAAVAAHLVDRGSGAPPSLPKDYVLLTYSIEGSQAILVLMDGRSGEIRRFPAVGEYYEKDLERLMSSLRGASRIGFAIPDAKDRRNEALHALIIRSQHWLTANGLTKCEVAFY
jgi:hypothetical protein